MSNEAIIATLEKAKELMGDPRKTTMPLLPSPSLIYTEAFWKLYVLWCRGVITVEEMDYLSKRIR